MEKKDNEKQFLDAYLDKEAPTKEKHHCDVLKTDPQSEFNEKLRTMDTLMVDFKEKVKNFISENEFELDTEDDYQLMESVIRIWDIVITQNRKMKQEFMAATKALKNDPRLAVLFNEIIRETPIRVALVRAGIYDFTPQPQDSDYNEYQNALKTHRQRREDYEIRRISHNENCKHTAGEIDKFYKMKNASEDDVENFSKYTLDIFEGFVNGIIDCRLLEFLWRGFIYDKSVEDAKEVGKIEGRNEIIEKRIYSMEDDGISHRGSYSNTAKPVKDGYIKRIMNGNYN